MSIKSIDYIYIAFVDSLTNRNTADSHKFVQHWNWTAEIECACHFLSNGFGYLALRIHERSDVMKGWEWSLHTLLVCVISAHTMTYFSSRIIAIYYPLSILETVLRFHNKCVASNLLKCICTFFVSAHFCWSYSRFLVLVYSLLVIHITLCFAELNLLKYRYD